MVLNNDRLLSGVLGRVGDSELKPKIGQMLNRIAIDAFYSREETFSI